jgi:hypothetical protein
LSEDTVQGRDIIVLGGSPGGGTVGLMFVKARGGVAIVQDPREAAASDMPRSAMAHVDFAMCCPSPRSGLSWRSSRASRWRKDALWQRRRNFSSSKEESNTPM